MTLSRAAPTAACAGLREPVAQPALRGLLVDDHRIVSDGVRLLVQHLLPEAVVVQAETLESALAELGAGPRVDFAVVDLTLADSKGAATVERIRAAAPGVSIVVYTGASSSDDMRACEAAGVLGVVSKASPMEDLREALGRMLGALARLREPVVLTERQREVLRLVRQGLGNKEIARELKSSPFTVRIQVSEILSRLNAKTRAQAVDLIGRVVPPL